MIQAFQKFSQSFVAKAFLVVVALSFAAFFGGSNYFGSRHAQSVAEVGDMTISMRDFRHALEQEVRAIQARTEQTISAEDLVQMGLANSVLNTLISNALLDQEANSLGLAASNMEILDTIHSIKAFQNESGQFDRTLFDRILYSNRMNEDSFVDEVKSELIRKQLMGAVVAGAFAPKVLSDLILDAQFQIRQGAIVTIEPKNMPLPANPGDSVLEAFYTEHKDAFMQPELRSFTTVLLQPETILGDVSITDEDIQKEYDATKEDFGNKPLADVKDKVRKNLTKQLAADRLYELSQTLEDEIAGGMSLEELAKTYKLKLVTAEALTQAGTDAEGNTAPKFVPNEDMQAQIISEGFSTDEGVESTFTETTDGSYFVVRADKVNPAQPLAFADVKNRVYKEWANVQQVQEAYKSAGRIVQGINLDRTIPGTLSLLPNVSLANPSKDIPGEVLEVLYRLVPGKAGIAPTDKGFIVVMLKNIIPASPQLLNSQKEKVEKETLQLLQSDVLQSYLNALRIRYPLKVNWEAVQAAVGA